MNDFDVIVVGAGPAGVAAALTVARQGGKVALLEKGPYPGAKNLMGGILYTDVLARLVPDFVEKGAPLERYVGEKRWSLLSEETASTFGFQAARWDKPPHNHAHTVLRARFDRWFAGLAEEAGVELICGVVVDELLTTPEGAVTGVVTRVEEGTDAAEGRLQASVVILAEGANALLAEKHGLKPPMTTGETALGVKEVLKLDRSRIEDRFGVEGNRGMAWEFIGAATGGLPGAGFIYTNRETISVGVVAYLSEVAEEKVTPAELLDRFKSHPKVRPLVKEGELLEYGAHLIPETGFNGMPLLAKEGLLAVGDCAGLLSTSPSHEGSNYAMASGEMAGLAAMEAVEAKDVTVVGLSGYKRRLEESFVWKKMEKYGDWPGFLRGNPQLFSRWPAALGEMVQTALTVDNSNLADGEKVLWELFQRRVGVLPFAMTALQLRNALKILGHGKTDQLLDYVARNW